MKEKWEPVPNYSCQFFYYMLRKGFVYFIMPWNRLLFPKNTS